MPTILLRNVGDSRISAQKVEHLGAEDAKSACEQPSSTTADMGNLFLVSRAGSVVVLDTRAAADHACFRWLERHGLRRVPSISREPDFALAMGARVKYTRRLR